MRLFIAIPFPQGVNDYCTTLNPQIRTIGKIRITHDLHCTLRFIGNTTPEQAQHIRTQLHHVTFNKFTCALAPLNTFGTPTQPTVLWIGLQSKELHTLHQNIISTLKIIPDNTTFIPHCTLCRIKRVTNTHALQQLLTTQVPAIEWTVDHFLLINSTPAQHGHEYQIIKTYKAKRK